jgi:poly(beta-D-mannuronate) lyase
MRLGLANAPWKVLAVLLLSEMVAYGSGPLRSPWDLATINVKDGKYNCSTLDALPKDISAYSFYDDDKHSQIDPKLFAAYNEAQAKFRATTAAVEAAADSFQATGNRSAANCVLQQLNIEAAADAMTGEMASNQSYYVQNWTLGALAVSWLKVRDAEPGTAEQRASVVAWLTKVAHATETYFSDRHEKKTKDGQNNHYYWAGFAVMSVGIAADEHAFFDWGVGTYNDAMQRIEPEGTLPLEMDRGQRALHYHLFALAPLVTMAEFGSANGVDMYGANHGALHRLVARSIAGLVDNSYFTAKAGVKQDTPENGKIKSEDIVWVTPYLRRFPNGNLSRLLNSVALKPYGYLGGVPPS